MKLLSLRVSAKVIFTVISIVLSLGNAQAAEFSIPTTDGLYTLKGQIDFPDQVQKSFPLVVMIPGTGLFDREGFIGHSGTDRDFIFKDLSKALNAKGIATLRFDYRGVYCNSRKNPDISVCVDNAIRQTVTPENMRSDFAQLFNYGTQVAGVDPAKVSVFAHSEGTLHTSRLIGAKLINPKFVTFMGMVAESPKSIIYFQMVDRQVDEMFGADTNKDSILTNQEVQTACDSYHVPPETCEHLKSPTGSWSRETFATPYKAVYQQIYDDAIKADDAAAYIPVPAKKTVQASYRWWKMWFQDDRNAMDDLMDYKGKIYAHNGTIDSQTPGVREFNLIRSKKSQFVSFPDLKLYPGKGHTLGNDPVYGPIDLDIRDGIVNQIVSAMKDPSGLN